MLLLLLLQGGQVNLLDDGRTNRQTELLSVLRVVWSKIRSSIKIALWNLSALCQWSRGMFSCWHLSPPIQRLLSLSASSLSSSHLPDVFFFLLSSVSLSTPQTVCLLLWAFVRASSRSSLLRASYIATFPGWGRCLSRCFLGFLSSDVVYSGGSHSCVLRQGWLQLSCPRGTESQEGEGVR